MRVWGDDVEKSCSFKGLRTTEAETLPPKAGFVQQPLLGGENFLLLRKLESPDME